MGTTRYFRHWTKDRLPGAPRYPSIGPLNGLRPMRRHHAMNVFLAQGAALWTGCRPVCTWGMRGESGFHAVDFLGNWDTGLTGTSLPKWEYRTTARARATLTPGYTLRASLVYQLSGATIDATPEFDGARGDVTIDVTWTDADGNSTSTSHVVGLDPSATESGSPHPGKPGAEQDDIWAALREVVIDLHPTPAILSDEVSLRKWTRGGTTVEIAVKERGGARIVDGCVYEAPVGIAMRVTDTASDPTPPHPVDNPVYHGSVEWPYEGQSDETVTDGSRRFPQYGTHHLMAVNAAQVREMGPTLACWSAWTGDQSIGSTDAVVTISDTSFRHLEDASITAWSATAPGVAIGSGGYARTHELADESFAPTFGVIPVRLHVYGEIASGDTGTVRLQASADSYVEAQLTSTSAGWVSDRGYLRVPKNPSGEAVLGVPLVKSATGAGVNVRAWSLEWDRR